MRKVRNITVEVSPETYRETRRLAADYETTVTAMVVYFLERMPLRLMKARARAEAAQQAQSAPSPSTPPTPPLKNEFPAVPL
jgi:uncharacterized DUF497 family protein